jgi:CheY-like chemotaxis protein
MPPEEYGIQLGWSVAQQLVAALSGHLWSEQLDSNLSTWCLEFDFCGHLVSLADQPKSLAGNKILVFDSNDEEIAALTELLEFQGALVLAANDIHQIIHHIETFMPIDTLIVNHTESHLDLCGTIDLLAMRIEPARMVLLLPKTDLTNDVQLCHDLGIGAFISKPIRQEALISTIQNLGKPHSNSDEIQAPSHSNCLCILLAEDNNAAQWVGRKTLEKNGHTVQVVDNGIAVLAQLDNLSSDGQSPFDVVLMDIEMPGMDGFETTRAIRQHEAGTGRHLPILMLTAHALKEHREECFAAGADDYLVKPLSPAKLVQVLEKFKPMAHPAPTVDLERALEMCGNDWDLLRSSVKIFLTEDYARQIEQLRHAITNQDSPLIQKSAHNLQGALDSLGGGATRDLALKIEQAGREKRITDVAVLVNELETRMREFADFYHQLD